MKTMLSTGFRLTAIASLGFWWVWFIGGAAFYYTVKEVSLWASFTSGAGISLVMSVIGLFCAMFSEMFEPEENENV